MFNIIIIYIIYQSILYIYITYSRVATILHPPHTLWVPWPECQAQPQCRPDALDVHPSNCNGMTVYLLWSSFIMLYIGLYTGWLHLYVYNSNVYVHKLYTYRCNIPVCFYWIWQKDHEKPGTCHSGTSAGIDGCVKEPFFWTSQGET